MFETLKQSVIPVRAAHVLGRPRKMRPDQQEVARDLIRDGKSVSEVAKTFNVHPTTIYRCIDAEISL